MSIYVGVWDLEVVTVSRLIDEDDIGLRGQDVQSLIHIYKVA